MSYTINVSLPKNLAKLAKQQVNKGYYSSLSELIREALRDKFLSREEIPTFPMSKKREKIALKAIEDYRKGKTTLLEHVEDLARL